MGGVSFEKDQTNETTRPIQEHSTARSRYRHCHREAPGRSACGVHGREAAVASAVSKHTDPATAALIMGEVDAELTAVEAEIDRDIEAFRIKL